MTQTCEVTVGRVIAGLVIGLIVTVGALFVGVRIVGLDAVSLDQLLLVAVALMGVAFAIGIVQAVSGGGAALSLWLLSQSASAWVIKSILAISWGSAWLVWLVCVGASLVVFLVFALLGAAVTAGARKDNYGGAYSDYMRRGAW